MPKTAPPPKQRRPSITALRALSNAILCVQLEHMPESLDDGDPVAIAERIRADALQSEYGIAYQWILDNVRMAALTADCGNPAFAELETVRALANSLADYLSWKGKASEFEKQIAQLRNRLDAIRLVAAIPSLSESSKAELEREEARLRWLDTIGRKGDLREHYLVYEIYFYFRIFADVDPRAACLVDLFVAATDKDLDSVLRVLSRHLSKMREEFSADS